MQILIDSLKDALQTQSDLVEVLNTTSALCWQADYPVAVVHEARRIKEEEVVSLLEKEKLLNAEGFTPKVWDETMLEKMKELAPDYVKEVSMLVHRFARHSEFTFEEKREKDYWKKVVDDGSFVATVEHSVYTEGAEICEIESDLRDLMRSSKEVPSLKEIGFIWIVEAPMNMEVDKILAHYYQKNWMMVIAKEKTVYIGWHGRLGSVDMRHFVCPPNKK